MVSQVSLSLSLFFIFFIFRGPLLRLWEEEGGCPTGGLLFLRECVFGTKTCRLATEQLHLNSHTPEDLLLRQERCTSFPPPLCPPKTLTSPPLRGQTVTLGWVWLTQLRTAILHPTSWPGGCWALGGLPSAPAARGRWGDDPFAMEEPGRKIHCCRSFLEVPLADFLVQCSQKPGARSLGPFLVLRSLLDLKLLCVALRASAFELPRTQAPQARQRSLLLTGTASLERPP